MQILINKTKEKEKRQRFLILAMLKHVHTGVRAAYLDALCLFLLVLCPRNQSFYSSCSVL